MPTVKTCNVSLCAHTQSQPKKADRKFYGGFGKANPSGKWTYYTLDFNFGKVANSIYQFSMNDTEDATPTLSDQLKEEQRRIADEEVVRQQAAQEVAVAMAGEIVLESFFEESKVVEYASAGETLPEAKSVTASGFIRPSNGIKIRSFWIQNPSSTGVEIRMRAWILPDRDRLSQPRGEPF